MLGKRPPQRELFRPDSLLLDQVGRSSFYAYLSREAPRLFKDSAFKDFYGEGGRPSVPPSQLCTLMVLQAKEGVSDQEAIDRTSFDIRWKVALGLEIEEKLCAKSTLQLFRSKLLLDERYLSLFEASVQECRRGGLAKSKGLEVAIDTTPIIGHGAVKDTYNLVSDGIQRVVEEAVRLKGWDKEQLIDEKQLEGHFGSSFKGEAHLDWSDREERSALLARLVDDARRAIEIARRGLKGYAKVNPKTFKLREAQTLLKSLLSQDIDESPTDGGGPQIREGTTRDRVISTTDPDMRHGHKSHSKGFDGYKGSVVVDTKDGVVLATDVRRANVADHVDADVLVEAAANAGDESVVRVLGDTAYGNSETRTKLTEKGVEVVAKAPPANSKGGVYRRTDFDIDNERGVATCPAGKESIRRSQQKSVNGGWVYHFSRNACTPCPLRDHCTKSKTLARTVTDSPQARELDRHRKAQKTKRFKMAYRRRIAVEHAIGRMRAKGMGKARYFGLPKVAMQVAMAAMVANLGLAAARLRHERVAAWISATSAFWAAIHSHLSGDPDPRMVRLVWAPSRPGL